MTVLVTGATGFIGSHLVAALARDGAAVRALVRPETDAAALVAGGIDVVRGDVRDAGTTERAVAGCRVVYHAAAHRRHGVGPTAVAAIRAINEDGTRNVARAALAAGVERLVFCSAVKVYGMARAGVIDEETERAPATPYARSKVRAEDALRDLVRSSGLPVVVARLGGTLGPGAIGWLGLFRSIAEGRFRLRGPGTGRYQAGDVDDIVAGLLRCGRTPGVEGRVYHLTGPRPVRLSALVEAIGDAVGARPAGKPASDLSLRVLGRLQPVAMRLTGRSVPGFSQVEFFLGDREFDISRARRELGYDPQIDLEESIRRTVVWYRERGWLHGAGS